MCCCAFAFWLGAFDHGLLGDGSAKSNEAVGAALGIITAIVTAAFLLCFRAAADYAERNTILFALVLWSALFNSLITLTRYRQTPRPDRSWVISAVALATMTLIGNGALAAALPLVGAGVMSTIMQLQVFFVAFGAWAILREPVSVGLLVGAALAAAGFAFFALPGQSTANLSLLGLLGGLVTGVAFAGMIIWTRAVIKNLDPVSLNAGRLWLATGALALWPGTVADSMRMPMQGWLLMAGAAVAGPGIGRLCVMYSLRYISAAKTKLWGMLSPVFAFLLVFLIYGIAPSQRETIGGLLIIGGVFLPTIGRLRSWR